MGSNDPSWVQIHWLEGSDSPGNMTTMHYAELHLRTTKPSHKKVDSTSLGTTIILFSEDDRKYGKSCNRNQS